MLPNGRLFEELDAGIYIPICEEGRMGKIFDSREDAVAWAEKQPAKLKKIISKLRYGAERNDFFKYAAYVLRTDVDEYAVFVKNFVESGLMTPGEASVIMRDVSYACANRGKVRFISDSSGTIVIEDVDRSIPIGEILDNINEKYGRVFSKIVWLGVFLDIDPDLSIKQHNVKVLKRLLEDLVV